MFTPCKNYCREFQDELSSVRKMLYFIQGEWESCGQRHQSLYGRLVAFDLRLQWIMANWAGLWEVVSRQHFDEGEAQG